MSDESVDRTRRSRPALEYPCGEPPAAGEAREIAPGVLWIRMPLPFSLANINLWAIRDGEGWAIAGTQLLRLGERWEPVGAPGEWRVADALFATRDRAWVVETAAGLVHRFDGAAWHATASVIARPRALWGARPDALWLAGDGGLAYFDGGGWQRVVGAPTPLTAVGGRGADEVWIGGEGGLFRVERSR